MQDYIRIFIFILCIVWITAQLFYLGECLVWLAISHSTYYVPTYLTLNVGCWMQYMSVSIWLGAMENAKMILSLIYTTAQHKLNKYLQRTWWSPILSFSSSASQHRSMQSRSCLGHTIIYDSYFVLKFVRIEGHEHQKMYRRFVLQRKVRIQIFFVYVVFASFMWNVNAQRATCWCHDIVFVHSIRRNLVRTSFCFVARTHPHSLRAIRKFYALIQPNVSVCVRWTNLTMESDAETAKGKEFYLKIRRTTTDTNIHKFCEDR